MFEDLLPAQRVVIRHLPPPVFVLTVTLQAEGGLRRSVWQQCFESAEMAQRLAPVVVPANEQNLDRLHRLLAGVVVDGG